MIVKTKAYSLIQRHCPGGVILNRDLSTVYPVDMNNQEKIQEFVSHSWYDYSSGKNKGLHPYEVETNLNYTGPKPLYKQLNVDESYSWIKLPRWMLFFQHLEERQHER